MLSSSDENLIARIDIVEGDSNAVIPVDYKRGAVPDIPDRAWDADRVQLCAQGLVLRDNGYQCAGGAIYYVESKTKVPVEFDADLLTKTRLAITGIRSMAEKGVIPPPLEDSPKCFRCSLAGICLPDETNMLAGRIKPDGDALRRIMPARDDAMPL